jgi:hypothetical protein
MLRASAKQPDRSKLVDYLQVDFENKENRKLFKARKIIKLQ